MVNYFGELALQLGIPIWILIVILAWSLVWKLIAFWKSARKGHLIWFIVFAFVNTVGILEILYIYLFSEMGGKKKPKDSKKVRKNRK